MQHLFPCIISILDCDIGVILFKEPTVEKKETPKAPKPTVVPVEKKFSPPEGIVLVYITVFFFPFVSYSVR